MKEEAPAAKTIDLLLELINLEDDLDAAQTLPLVEVGEDDVIDETVCLKEEEFEEVFPDTKRTPSLEAEMILRQEDPFQSISFLAELEPALFEEIAEDLPLDSPQEEQ